MDLKHPSPPGGTPGQFGNKGKRKLIDNILMMEMVIDSGAGVRDLEHMEEGGLFDLFISIKICLKAWKDLLFHRSKKLGIVEGRVEDNFSTQNQLPFLH